jgi:hypothetical protein
VFLPWEACTPPLIPGWRLSDNLKFPSSLMGEIYSPLAAPKATKARVGMKKNPDILDVAYFPLPFILSRQGRGEELKDSLNGVLPPGESETLCRDTLPWS